MRARFAAIWLLLTAAVAGIAAYLAYGAGQATKFASDAAAGGAAAVPPPYYYGYYGHPWGFGFFGFLFFLFILFLVLRVAFFRGRGGWHRGMGYGPGYGKGGGPLEDRLQEWHKKAHGDAEAPKEN